MKDKPIGYVVATKTLKELEELTNKMAGQISSMDLFKCEIDRPNMSDEQKEIQKRGSWQAHANTDIRIGDATIYEKIVELAYDKIANGLREGLEEELYDGVMNTEIKCIVVPVKGKEYGRVDITYEFGTPKEERYTYSEDLDELKKKLEKVKYSDNYFLKPGEHVYLENVTIRVYRYAFYEAHKDVEKMIKRFMRNEMTYCIKKDKIIVPEEYIARGKEGIAQWREMKKNSSKSNNMEKRMIKQLFRDKREAAYFYMMKVADQISISHNWSLPSMTVDGRWNRGKMDKLVTKLLNTKDKKAFMDMPSEDMLRKTKDYWKDKLMEAYKAIDEITLEQMEELRSKYGR